MGNSLSYQNRFYNPHLGRWLSKDPVKKHHISQYQFGSNNPINFLDPDGNDEIHFTYYSYQIMDGHGKVYTAYYFSVKVIEKIGNHSFFVHDRFDQKITEIFPFQYENGMIFSNNGSHAAGVAALPFSTGASVPFSGIFGGNGHSTVNDFIFLGRIIQSTPELTEHYKNDPQMSRAFNFAQKNAGTYEFGEYVKDRAEVGYAIVGGVALIRGLGTFALTRLGLAAPGATGSLLWTPRASNLFRMKEGSGLAFGSRNGYGPLGRNGLTMRSYRLDLLYSNPTAGEGAGTFFSLRQMNGTGGALRGGNMFRLDYGLLHNTSRMGLHSTIRFTLNGTTYGSSAQRLWYPSSLQAPFFKPIPKSN